MCTEYEDVKSRYIKTFVADACEVCVYNRSMIGYSDAVSISSK
jgi:hypothetical protein